QVVKEQFRSSLSSQPRPRILQQPFFLSSCFSKNFFFLLNDLRLSESFASHQREANSTAFQPAVNTSFSVSFGVIRTKPATPETNLAPPFHRIDQALA
ncbi:hypothetical protein R9X34_20505, partial [Pseudomonas sp. 2023EL-01195]|nr:hypothetical protein [Pseudomonas sp. 2023EL-01195]